MILTLHDFFREFKLFKKVELLVHKRTFSSICMPGQELGGQMWVFSFVCRAAETTAAVGISLSSDGQSIAYQLDYEPQWKTKRLLRGLGDNTKDYLTCSSPWPSHIVGVLNPPVATTVLISVWFTTSHLKKGALWSIHCELLTGWILVVLFYRR